MRKLLNTLYILTPNAYLSKDGLNVVMSVDQQETFRIPIHNIEGIVSFTYMGISPGLMKLCADSGIGVSMLSPNGQFISRLQGPVKGNVLLRLAHYNKSQDEEYCLHLSKIMISGKVANQRAVLRRQLRDYGENQSINTVADKLKVEKAKILKCDNLETLRGLEGIAANNYFGVFDNLIIQQKETFKFTERSRRPPKDEVNVLLSFIYTLIVHEITSALESVGLDPYIGFMHTIRPGRPSLALDLMEELRPYLGDRLVISLINRRQISKDDFIYPAENSILLTDKGRKTVLSAWQMRKKQEITHPYLNEKIPIGLLPYTQALLLSRFVRGDINDYPVFLIE